MDIAFCVNSTFVPYTFVTVKSILVNNYNEELSFYFLVDRISPKYERQLIKIIGDYPNAHCHIIQVDNGLIAGLRTNGVHECIWYRILLPNYLPSNVERVLFLDADTLVLGGLRELFSINMEKCAVAGCLDPLHFIADTYDRLGYEPELGYINAGVLLINLDYWRRECLMEIIIGYARENEAIIKYKDQDSINYICRRDKRILPLKYGIMDCFLSVDWPWKESYSEELRECRLHPGIIHFAGNAPWAKEFCHRPFHDDWQRYNLMLSHPVRRRYITKGLPFLKMMVWKILH